MTTMSPGKLLGLRRLADARGRFKMLAIDQRPPIEKLVTEARGVDRPDFDDVVGVKRMLLANLAPHASATLMDPQYIFPSGIEDLPHHCGLLITLEYDVFEETPWGRRSRAIPDWSVHQIRSAGGDAVKVLAWYRPDADQAIKEHQEEFVADIGAECVRLDIPFVFELLLYPFPGEDTHTSDYVEHPEKRSEDVVASVETFAHPRFGVDLFKLESPIPVSAISNPGTISDSNLAEAFASLNRAAARPWVMLSAGADPVSFQRILELAFDAGASGYLAGRAIWWEPCVASFPDWEAMKTGLEAEAVPYMEKINDLTDSLALPWTEHPGYGASGPQPPPAGEAFRLAYGEGQT